MQYAGIDWADQHHEVVVINEHGRRVGATRVAHSVEGLDTLVAFLREASAAGDEIACIIETPNGLLVSALLDAGLAVYPVNPGTVDRKRAPSGAKTDALDAYLLARTGRSDLADLRRLQLDGPLIRELKVLTRDQETLVRDQTRLVNQLTACLKAYYPMALRFFSKLQQGRTLAFLTAFPTPAAVHAATPESILAAMRAVGQPIGAAQAREIVATAQGRHLQADDVVTRAKARLMVALVAQLQVVLSTVAAYDREIGRLFVQHADAALFASLPRAGKRLAPRLLAEWGDDRTRYGSAAAVQALGGTSPVPKASGKLVRAQKRYACNKSLRDALYQFAWQSTLKEEWAAAYYQRKRREGKTHAVAVRALANQWVRIIFAIWRKGETYTSAVFLAAQHAHAPRAA
jgi:transposase